MMKKVLFVLVLLLLFSRTFAPTHTGVVIYSFPPVEPFKKLIYAVGMVEGMCDTSAFNIIEEAAGYFQIRPVRVEDYNIRTRSNYTLDDMFDYEIAEKVFLYYAGKLGPYKFEEIARKWNGSGHKTEDYWRRIKMYL
jgi:hypothetical protein